MCLEMMPSWCGQDKLRELWDSLSELRSSVCERDISCDAHLLNELLETDVPRDDAIVVWAG